MKKLVFAVIAAVAMVSVSNVFAGNRMVSVAGSEPVDTVAPAYIGILCLLSFHIIAKIISCVKR